MAFSNFAYTTQATGACSGMRNSGTNGDLNAILHTALTTGSNWTRVNNTSANHMTWAPSGGGIVLQCRHDSAVSGDARLATMRLAESQAAGVLTDPIPTIAQVADTSSVWFVSNAASTTTRDFQIVVWETGIVYATKFSGATDVWEMHYAVKGNARYGISDPYQWTIGVRNSTNVAAALLMLGTTVPGIAAAQGKNFFMRNIAGTIKSEQGNICTSGGSVGNVTGAPAIGAGVFSNTDAEKILLSAGGSNTTTNGPLPVHKRLQIPQLYSPVHSVLTGLGEADTFPMGASNFVLLKNVNNGILLRTTNDDSGYPGG